LANWGEFSTKSEESRLPNPTEPVDLIILPAIDGGTMAVIRARKKYALDSIFLS